MNTLHHWLIQTSVVAFTTYWLANLLLWYPWSYDYELGMTLMFMAITPLWIIAVYHCLKGYPGKNSFKGALSISAFFSYLFNWNWYMPFWELNSMMQGK